MFVTTNTLKKVMANVLIAIMTATFVSPAFAAEQNSGVVLVKTNLALGSYSIQDLLDQVVGTGNGILPISFSLPASDFPGTGYKIVYGAVAGANTPSTDYFNLVTGTSLNYEGVYTFVNATSEFESVIVKTNLALGCYEINPVASTEKVGEGCGILPISFSIPSSATPGTGYKISFKNVPGTVDLDPQYFNLVTGTPVSFEGIYTFANATSEFESVIVNTNLALGCYEITPVASTEKVGVGCGILPIPFSIPSSANPGTGYKITFLDSVTGFDPETPIVYFNLITTHPQTFVGLYKPEVASGTTGDVTVSTNLAQGTYVIKTASGTQVGNGNGISPIQFNLPASANPGIGYQIEFANVILAGTPYAVDNYPSGIAYFNLKTGDNLTTVGHYSPVTSSSTGTIQINVKNDAGTPVTGASWTLTGGVNGTATQTLTSVAFGDYTLTATLPPAFSTLYSGFTVTPATAQSLNATNRTITFEVVYQRIGTSNNTATLSVTANVANAPVYVDDFTTPVGNAGPTIPVTKVVAINVAHTIRFGDVSGYTKPADVTIDANTMSRSDTKNVVGTYTLSKLVTITKTATEIAVANNNKRVSYTLVVTNVGTTPLNVRVSDTITGTGKIVNNGGELVYVPGTFTCTGAACTLATPNGIANQPVTVALQTTGSAATLKYEMLSNNSAQTGPATFANTATAIYTDPANSQAVTTTVVQTTVVSAPAPVTPINTGGGGGGGGGGGSGGGYTLVKGDMKLIFQKKVSLDGTTFRDALGQNQALAIPENKATRLTTKMTITNPGNVSAVNLRLTPIFESGKSDMTADKIQDLKGATLDNQGRILIEKIKSQEIVSISYSVLVHENGNNVNPALEGIQVTQIKSALSEVQDGLVYKNLGEKVVTYLYAGIVPAMPKVATDSKPVLPTVDYSNNSGLLSIHVNSDKSQAAIGDVVNFTLTLKNMSDGDLTNLSIMHDLPAELNVLNSGGGLYDGDQIIWKAAILRPGEQMIRQFQAKVVAGTPGKQIRSLTSVLVSEAEISPVDSYLMILGGAPSPVAKAYRLAQTGPGGILALLMLSILSVLAFNFYGKRRNMRIREMALRPL